MSHDSKPSTAYVSVKAVNWVLGLRGIKAGPKSVLFVLATHANETKAWTTFVGLDTVAEEAGMTTRSAEQHARWLEANGYIHRARRHRNDGSLGTYMTTVHYGFDPAAKSSGSPAEESSAHKKEVPKKEAESKSFAVEAPLPPMNTSQVEPVEDWARFRGHSDYAALIASYRAAAYWKTQRDLDAMIDAEDAFWGNLYTLTDAEETDFNADQWTIRASAVEPYEAGKQLSKILQSAAQAKGSPLLWQPHGKLHNPWPTRKTQLTAA